MSSPPISDSSIIQYTQICVYCGYCSVCPTYKEIGWEKNHPRGILQQINSYYLRETNSITEKTLFEAVFDCTLCGACQNICIVDIPLVKIWEKIRQESFRKGKWNKDMVELIENVQRTHNIYGLDPDERLNWTALFNINLSRRVQKTKPYVYFFGCQASYSGKMMKIAESAVKLLREAKIDFTVLGNDEWCCGSPIFLGGGYDIGKSLAKHNMNKIKELNAETLVVACSGCYRTFKNVYPSILGESWDIDVVHISELLNEMIDKGKIKIKKEILKKITYKDPCELVRHTGLVDPPREIIHKLKNVRFEELISNKEDALCCGGGGLLKVNNNPLVEEVNERLIDEIEYSETEMVVSCCPVCKDTIGKGVKRRNLDMEVLDITELLLQVTGLEDEVEE